VQITAPEAPIGLKIMPENSTTVSLIWEQNPTENSIFTQPEHIVAGYLVCTDCNTHDQKQ
jgi:hypothetical protein